MKEKIKFIQEKKLELYPSKIRMILNDFLLARKNIIEGKELSNFSLELLRAKNILIDKGGEISKGLAIRLSRNINYKEVINLVALASLVKDKYRGKKYWEIEKCSTGYGLAKVCPEGCRACIFRPQTEKVIARPKFLLSADAFVEDAKRKIKKGAENYKIVAPIRGLDNPILLKKAVEVVERIKKEVPQVKQLCASLGIITPDAAILLKNAGVSEYNHNLESGKKYFDSTNYSKRHSYSDKINTIKYAYAAGMGICSGILVGEGENMADRLELFEEIRSLIDKDKKPMIDSSPFNIFVPVTKEHLTKKRISDEEALISLAMFRIMCPKQKIITNAGRVYFRNYLALTYFIADGRAMYGSYLTRGVTENQNERIIKIIKETKGSF